MAKDSALKQYKITFHGEGGDVEIAHNFKLNVGSSRVDLQACKLEYSIVSPK